MNYKNFFDITLREANLDRINKFSNLTDEQKEEVREFYKKNTTGYNDFIDWQHPDKVTYDDFLKAKQAKENSKSQLRKKRGEKIRSAYDDVMKFFDRDDFIYQGENDDWLFVSPLSWEACKYADSIDCGGGRAGWCIGWEKSDIHWNLYVGAGNAFILAFNKHFKDVENKDDGIKYMIRFNDTGYNSDLLYGREIGDIWNQLDYDISKFYNSNPIPKNVINITEEELLKYSEVFWKKLEETNPDVKSVCQYECHNGLKFDEDSESSDIRESLITIALEKVDVDDDKNPNIVERVEDIVNDYAYVIQTYNPWDYLVETCPTVFELRRKYDDCFKKDENEYNAALDAIIGRVETELKKTFITDIPLPTSYMKYENYRYTVKEIEFPLDSYTLLDGNLSLTGVRDDNPPYLLDYSAYEQIKERGYRVDFNFYLFNVPNIFTTEDVEDTYFFDGIYNSNIDNLEYSTNNRINRFTLVDTKINTASFLKDTTILILFKSSIENLNNSNIHAIQLLEDSFITNSNNSSCNKFGSISKFTVSSDLIIKDDIILIEPDAIRHLPNLNTSQTKKIGLKLNSLDYITYASKDENGHFTLSGESLLQTKEEIDTLINH